MERILAGVTFGFIYKISENVKICERFMKELPTFMENIGIKGGMIMVKTLNDIFEKIISLSEKRRLIRKNIKENFTYIISNKPDIKLRKTEKELKKLLEQIDYETIKIIQNIIYLGRDREYDIESTLEDIFRSTKRSVSKSEYINKKVEIEHILEKYLLDIH